MTLKQYILHQLREIRREMLTALEGLSEEELVAHEPEGRSPIAWIVEHCCANVDFFLHRGITGRFCVEHDRRFLAWPIIEPQPGDSYPPPEELAARWTRVMDASLEALESLPEEGLQEPSKSSRPPEPLVESCLRVINHHSSHLRQIWCLLGWRRTATKWPEQGTWLA